MRQLADLGHLGHCLENLGRHVGWASGLGHHCRGVVDDDCFLTSELWWQLGRLAECQYHQATGADRAAVAARTREIGYDDAEVGA